MNNRNDEEKPRKFANNPSDHLVGTSKVFPRKAAIGDMLEFVENLDIQSIKNTLADDWQK